MKRFHMHLAVEDIESNVRFYSTLFGAVQVDSVGLAVTVREGNHAG